MSKFLIFISLLIINVSAFAQADIKISQDEFLKRVLDGNITMRKEPWQPGGIPANQISGLVEFMKRKYPNFREAFLFAPTVKTNKYLYTIFWDWENRRCIYRAEEFNPKTKEILKESIDIKGTTVDVKYCEKAYGIKI